MKKAIIRFLLLSKRLYKKPSFVAILIMIPALALILAMISSQNSGIVRIALFGEYGEIGVSSMIMHDLKNTSSLICFEDATSADEAQELVATGKVDAAWIFRNNSAELAKRFSNSRSQKDFMVNIIERSETIPLRLSREKLAASIYKFTSKHMFLNYVRTNFDYLDSLSDEEITSYYDKFEINDELFYFSDINGNKTDISDANYLLSPLRGILSVLILLAAIASAMFFTNDKSNGLFSWIPSDKLLLFTFGYHMVTILNIAVFTLPALFILGVATTLAKEIFLLLLYSICCAAFALLAQLLFSNPKHLSAFMLLIVVFSIVLCPVFFNFGPAFLKAVLPPTHYINAAGNNNSIVYMCALSILLFIISFLFEQSKNLFKR